MTRIRQWSFRTLAACWALGIALEYGAFAVATHAVSRRDDDAERASVMRERALAAATAAAEVPAAIAPAAPVAPPLPAPPPVSPPSPVERDAIGIVSDARSSSSASYSDAVGMNEISVMPDDGSIEKFAGVLALLAIVPVALVYITYRWLSDEA